MRRARPPNAGPVEHPRRGAGAGGDRRDGGRGRELRRRPGSRSVPCTSWRNVDSIHHDEEGRIEYPLHDPGLRCPCGAPASPSQAPTPQRGGVLPDFGSLAALGLWQRGAARDRAANPADAIRPVTAATSAAAAGVGALRDVAAVMAPPPSNSSPGAAGNSHSGRASSAVTGCSHNQAERCARTQASTARCERGRSASSASPSDMSGGPSVPSATAPTSNAAASTARTLASIR